MTRTIAVAAALFAAVTAAYAAPKKSADEQGLRAQTKAWELAYNSGDVQSVAGQYAEDALLLPPNAPAVRGRAAIEKFWAKDMADSKAPGVNFVINYPTEVGVSGNMG